MEFTHVFSNLVAEKNHHVMNRVPCVHLGSISISLKEVMTSCSAVFFRHRDYPGVSSSRNGGYSSGGGGPDRSYPSMRSSYMDSRSRPYDSPYERQRMPPPSMSYPDPYRMRSGGGGGVDPYARDDYYRQRGPPLPMDHYGRGPPMRYVDLRIY